VDTGAMTAADFEAYRAGPRWPSLLASAPSLPRECRVEHTWVYEPGRFDTVTARTMLLTGSESDPALAEATRRAAAALPDAEIRMLEGHGHLAYRTDPALVAEVVRDFATP
jgi:pimeloyl-ACP methyl ester carboxylesterase